MIELDGRLRALRAHARAWGADLRSMALAIDADPYAVTGFRHLDVMRFLATSGHVPPGTDTPLAVGGGHRCRFDTMLETVVLLEELARGDAGALLAAPGAPMAGPLVRLLGDDQQQQWLSDRMRQAGGWAFFALTEPDRGSDAANLTTALTPGGDGYFLTGAKRYVGNASRAQLGVVFARTGPGPLGVRAVLVDTSTPGFAATALPTVGLRGALLGAVTMTSVYIPPERVLGRHLRASAGGARGWIRTFNLLRPVVAAIGVGLAQAAHDYVGSHRRTLRGSERDRFAAIGDRIELARQLTYQAAVAVDADPVDGSLASAAKARAARLAEQVTLAALGFFGPGARLEHRLLDKLARDARGLEFMEGTGHVQQLLVGQHVGRKGSGYV